MGLFYCPKCDRMRDEKAHTILNHKGFSNKGGIKVSTNDYSKLLKEKFLHLKEKIENKKGSLP